MTVEHQNEFSEFDFPRYEACPICHGRGLVSHPDAYEQEDCAACGGEGEVECQPFEPASQIQHVEYADVQRQHVLDCLAPAVRKGD